jgi:hypothetical protein
MVGLLRLPNESDGDRATPTSRGLGDVRLGEEDVNGPPPG